MKQQGMPERSTAMRACGKGWESEEAARVSKRGRLAGEGAAFAKCWVPGCGKWHITEPGTSGGLSTRAPLLPGPTHRDEISPEVRALVLERDHWQCVCCGVSILGRRYSLAHRVRAGQNGKAVPSNLIVLLGFGGEECHGRVDYYRGDADGYPGKGYRLRSDRDPLLIPVRIFRPEGRSFTAWLDNAGEYQFERPAGAA